MLETAPPRRKINTAKTSIMMKSIEPKAKPVMAPDR